MNKEYVIAGAIALGFIFLFKPKIKPVFAEESQNVHQPIPTFVESTSTNNTTSYSTFGAQNLMTVLD